MINITIGFNGKSPTLIIFGDTFKDRGKLADAGFKFRRDLNGDPYWEAEDTVSQRERTKKEFPLASGWFWMPPIGRRGMSDV